MENLDWINRSEYPFRSNYMEIDGHKIHYIDEGKGDTILFVHGTPVWSFLYRHIIKDLSKNYRCIAPDLLAFGLSGKPSGPEEADLTPAGHSARLGKFIDKLGVSKFHLVAQDFGGPISLSYAVAHPEKVDKIAISNSFFWSLKGEKHFEMGSKIFNNWFGRFLYLNYGFSAKFIIPASFGNKKKLTKEIHKHYLKPLDSKKKRTGSFAFVKALVGEGDWYNQSYYQRAKIADKKALLIWGMKDKFLPADILMDKWKTVFKDLKIVEVPSAGHFVEEEEPSVVAAELRRFLNE